MKHKNFAWFTIDGVNWSEPVQFGEPNFWIWSVSWHGGVAYGVGYPTTTNRPSRLYRSNDGRKWELLVESFHKGNESSIAFKPDGTAVCLIRSGSAIGQARSPHTEWSWKKTVDLGGPDLVRLADGRFIAGGRDGWGTMKLFELDPATGKATHWLNLPARGDSSYPGLVEHDGELWISYYSSADDAKAGGLYLVPSEIRLAKVKLSATIVPSQPLQTGDKKATSKTRESSRNDSKTQMPSESLESVSSSACERLLPTATSCNPSGIQRMGDTGLKLCPNFPRNTHISKEATHNPTHRLHQNVAISPDLQRVIDVWHHVASGSTAWASDDHRRRWWPSG